MCTTRGGESEGPVDEATEVTLETDAQGDAPKAELVDEIVIVSGLMCCHRQCVHILTELGEWGGEGQGGVPRTSAVRLVVKSESFSWTAALLPLHRLTVRQAS